MTRTEELLDEIATYADRLADSDNLADTGSMAAAEALAELYEKREWVDEWLEQKPIRERSAYTGGRPPQPDTAQRFQQWQAWKQSQRQRRTLQATQTHHLLAAHEVAQTVKSSFHGVKITSEWTLRPLSYFRKKKLIDHLPEVWQRAVELARSTDRVTSAHTSQALAEWKKANKGQVQVAIKTNKAERDRGKAQTAVEVLFGDGDLEQIRIFHNWYADLAERFRAKAQDQ
jgi:predicted transcriptional regulator